MNQGMYRAGPTAGGLPLPRARLGMLTGAIAGASVLAVIMPFALLMGRGPSGMWMTFRNGGTGMYLLALLDLALPVAVGIAGAVAMRGKRVPSGLFFGVAALPFVAALFFAYLGLRMVDGALSGGSVDPSQAMRINAAGVSEVLSLDVFGGFIACGCAIVGAVSAASVVASIDVATATRDDAQRPSAVFGAATLVAGAAWFVATIVLTAMRLKDVGPLVICSLLVVGTLVPFAVLAARAAPILRAWHDPVEARRGVAALLVAGLAAVFALLVFERAVLSSVGSNVFGALSGEGIETSQKARILAILVDARGWASIAYAIHAVLGTATFGLALTAAIGGGPSGLRHPFSPSSVIALSVGVFVLAATFGLSSARARSTERIAARGRDSLPRGLVLPVNRTSITDSSYGFDGTLILHADDGDEHAQVTFPPGSSGCGRPRRVTVWADRAATLVRLATVLTTVPCPLELAFVAAPEKATPSDARLGDLADFVHAEPETISAYFDATGPPIDTSRGFVAVRTVSPDTISYEGHEVKLPLGPDSPDLRSGTYPMVRFIFRPSDTIGTVVRVMSETRERFRSHFELGLHVHLEIDWPPRPRPPAPPSSGIRLLTPTVAGRLPPEVIQRIVRQNLGRVRNCYQDGLQRDPKLEGKVNVKFVIDRSGAVATSADAGSTLPDREVTACIVRALAALRYPEPEGGIVAVTYPMTLAP